MSYTHYWKSGFNSRDLKQFKEMVAKIVELAQSDRYKIALSWVEAKEYAGVIFNEALAADDENDAFHITPDTTAAQRCNTNRKPYDRVVVAALLAMKVVGHQNKVDVEVTTEGDTESWRNGMELFFDAYPDLIGTYSFKVDTDQTVVSIDLSHHVDPLIRVHWFDPKTPDNDFYHYVNSIAEGRQMIEVMTSYNEFQQALAEIPPADRVPEVLELELAGTWQMIELLTSYDKFRNDSLDSQFIYFIQQLELDGTWRTVT